MKIDFTEEQSSIPIVVTTTIIVSAILVLAVWMWTSFVSLFSDWIAVLLATLFIVQSAREFSKYAVLSRREFITVPGRMASLIVSAVAIIFSFALIYQVTGLILRDGSTSAYLPVAIYFSVVNFTTVGCSDVVPTPLSRTVVAAQNVIGYVFMALLVAHLVHSCMSNGGQKGTKNANNGIKPIQ